ncbi:restriction endonuclease subunit S [Streptococcus alactolyticus]|uniref:restriction endonuclease subunit S n=1 Tax=Streptococcus alactolyticus TaxID=29389 RepID=UPI003F9B4062
MKTKSKIPALRFKGFTDAWEERKLGELASFSKGNGYTKNDLVEFGDPIILYGRLYTKYETVIEKVDTFVNKKDNSIISEGSEVIVPASGESSEDISRASVVGKSGLILGGDLNIIKPVNYIDSIFLALTISNGSQRQEMSKRAQGKSVVHLHNSDLKQVNLLYPKLEEQQKIGTFFKQLDCAIALHQRKCDQTKELKKTMLQKMFPKKGERIPEIRFPEFTDEWEEKKLGEMLTERNVQQVPKEDAPLVSFTVENGVTPKTDRYDREFLVRTGDKKYKYTTFDDIVYNPANLKFGAIARNKFGDAVFSPIYVTLVADKEKVLPIFIERIVTNGNFIQESLRYQEGTVYERMSVKVPDFLSMKISIPSLPEQEAIGTYFQTLDQDIAQIEKKLADLKELKKALLRQLFV